MRSCDSDSQISQLSRSDAFKGASSSLTWAPHLAPSSPMAEEKPPAPQSVTERYRRRSRAASKASKTRFSWMAWPIWTAEEGASAPSSAEEKVAPCRPSRPVRPPTDTMRSPGLTSFLTAHCGRTPTVPQNTRGLRR